MVIIWDETVSVQESVAESWEAKIALMVKEFYEQQNEKCEKFIRNYDSSVNLPLL